MLSSAVLIALRRMRESKKLTLLAPLRTSRPQANKQTHFAGIYKPMGHKSPDFSL